MMNQWTMIKKEFKEMVRNYKLLIVPIVFMILGALQPITYYYMPDILKMATLPEGAVLQIPLPTSTETMGAVFGQFTQLGLFILILITMGAISNEIKNGVAETILVKPVSIKSYILSKWVVYFFLAILSVSTGVLIGLFYTTQLIGGISFLLVVKSTLLYLLFVLFFISLTLFFSSFFSSGIMAGGLSVFLSILLGIVSSLPFKLWYIPSYVLNLNHDLLLGKPLDGLILSIISILIYILLMFYFSIKLFKHKHFV